MNRSILAAALTLGALGIAGLVSANYLWASWLTTFVWILLLFGATAAFVRRGSAQAFWIGFAFFGLSYFILAMFADGALRMYPDRRIWHEPRLPTTHFLFSARPYLHAIHGNDADRLNDHQHLRGMGIIVSREPREYFIQVGHCLFTMAFAIFGGFVGSAVYWHDIRANPGEPLARG